MDLTVSSTLKKLSKNHTCFILRRFGLFLIHLQSKNKATLGNASNSNTKRLCDARNNSVTQKMSKVKSKTKTTNPVKFAKSESRTNSYAESAKTKPT